MIAAKRLHGIVRVQPAGSAHAKVIARLSECGATEPWSSAAVTRILDLPGCWGLLAVTADGDAVGFIMARVAADEAEILNLVVAARARRRGVGRALLAAALRRARRAGATAMYLEVAADNAVGRTLYESAGFRAVGNRADYYRNSTGDYTDAIIMKRRIVKSRPD